jgi:hypothetical protein
MSNDDSNSEKPVAGDGTQVRKPIREANWFGASQRPQEEFIDDARSNRLEDPVPSPEEKDRRDPPPESPSESTIVSPEAIR